MNQAIDALKDDVLLSLFSSRLDYSTAYAASEIVRDALHTALQQSTVSKLFGGRTVLNDRYPIVGRVGALYTKQLVGYK